MTSLDTVIYGDVTVLDMIIFAVVIIFVVILARIIGIWLKRSLSDRMEKAEMDKLIKVIQAIIILLGIWFALPSFNFDVGQLLVVGGTIGLIVAFASQKIVSNLGSGLFLLIERPVKPGDTIQVGDVGGMVQQIHILSTIIKTYDGIYVRVPNERVFTSDITNYVANPARRFGYKVSIGYRDDADEAKAAISGLLEEHPFVLKHPPPELYVSELGPSGVELTIFIWTPSKVWWGVQTEMLGKIKQLLDREGIEIPFPQRVISFARDAEIREFAEGGGQRAGKK
jgi:small-conductance mechanosensitive channel